MAQSNSIKRQFSTIKNASSRYSRDMNYQEAYKLQENNIQLQNAIRTLIQHYINILSKSIKDIEACHDQWKKVYAKNQRNITSYEHLWGTVDTAVDSINDYFSEQNNIVNRLKSIQRSIPNEEEPELLRDIIPQMRSDIDKRDKELKILEQQQAKLQTRIDQQRRGSLGYIVRKKVFRIPQNKYQAILSTVDKSITERQQSFEKERRKFRREATEIIEENTKAEIALSLGMKQQVTGLVRAFKISTKRINDELENCRPEEHLEQWKENIYQKNKEPVEGSDEQKKSFRRQHSYKSKANDTRICDKTACQSYESLESNLNDDEQKQKKEGNRQLSSQSSTDDEAKNDAQRTKKCDVSPESEVVDDADE